MKNTVKISDKMEMVGFIRSIGTECRFVSMVTETELPMNKTNNPWYGTVKLSHRNGLVNVNFVKSTERNLTEQNGEKTTYVAGSTWYHHEQTVNEKPLPLCVHNKDNSRFYVQYFPHRTIGINRYFLKGRELSTSEVEQMKPFIKVQPKSDFKPLVITLSIDSIRSLRSRRVNMLNQTVSRINTVQPSTPLV